MAQGSNQITINQEIAVTTSDANHTTGAPSRGFFASPSPRYARSQTHLSKSSAVQEASSSDPNVLHDVFGLAGTEKPERNMMRARRHGPGAGRQSTSVDDLIDFLRNQAPPPDNFMSIPELLDTRDNTSQPSQRDGWKRGLRLASLGSLRRKAASTRQSPNQIKLPDSAIAGTTIGGHRHIAISIPVEYLPFGPLPRCQYPVFPPHHPVHGPRPDAGRHRAGDLHGDLRGEPANSGGQPHRDPHRDSYGSSSRDSDSVLRFTDKKGVVTVLRTVSEAKHPSSHGERRDESPVIPLAQRQKLHHATTIATQSGRQELPCPLPKRLGAYGATTPGPSESIDKIVHDDRHLMGTSVATQTVPAITITAQEDRPAKQGSAAEVPQPNRASRGTTPPKIRLDERKSRRERVREKKRRDIEASRSSHSSRASTPRRKTENTVSSPTSTSVSSGDGESMIIPASICGPSEVATIVVPDVKPPTPIECSKIIAQPPAPMRPRDKITLVATSTEDEPSPPTTSQRGSDQDGEEETEPAWERKREGRQERGRESEDDGPPSASIQRRGTLKTSYEVQRELRMHDMERRMRRLERNGDIWLRAIVPMLNNLNQTLVMMHDDRLERSARRGRSPGSTRQSQRRLSAPIQGTLLDPETIEADVTGDGDSSVSGLETIEPIIRELQGASRVSMESSRGVIDDDDEDDGSMFGSF